MCFIRPKLSKKCIPNFDRLNQRISELADLELVTEAEHHSKKKAEKVQINIFLSFVLVYLFLRTDNSVCVRAKIGGTMETLDVDVILIGSSLENEIAAGYS